MPSRRGPPPAESRAPAGPPGARPLDSLAATTAALDALASGLAADLEPDELLTVVAERCTALLGPAEVGVVLVGDAGDRRPVARSPAVRALLGAASEGADGPIAEILGSPGAAPGTDLLDAARWPRFAARARDAGFSGAPALSLRQGGAVLGAVAFFTRDLRGHLDEPALVTVQAIVDVAAVAVAKACKQKAAIDLAGQLSGALESRVVIEQAKGMLAERLRIGVDLAFGVLRSYSRNANERISAVARRVVDDELSTPELLGGARRARHGGQDRTG